MEMGMGMRMEHGREEEDDEPPPFFFEMNY
jgi:hypothetical protein